MISNSNVIFSVSCLKRRFGNWVCTLLRVIVVILQVVIVITTIIIVRNSHQFSWFSNSRVLLTTHVLPIILLQAPSLYGIAASNKCASFMVLSNLTATGLLLRRSISCRGLYYI